MTGGASEPFEQAETRGGLTLERYAEIMAHVRHFPRSRSTEVLRRLGLTEARWEDAVLAWTDALAAESALEEEALSRRFGATFVAAAARLKKEQPALPSLGPLPEELAPAPPPAAGADAAGGERGGEEEREAPATAAPAPAAPRIEMPSYAIAAAQSPMAAAAPAVAVPPAIVPPAVVPPAVVPPAVVPPAVVPPAVVPPAVVRPPVDPSVVPVGMRQFSSIQQTHPVADAGKGAALPFEPPSPGAPPPPAERAPPPPAEAAAAPRRAAPAGRETEDISSVMANLRQQGTVLPFAQPAKPAQAPRAPEPARPAQGPPAVAPSGAAGPSSPTLSLEQYASLCVELSLHPGRTDETLKRYRITEEQRARLDAYWQARIAGDPGVASAWKRAYVFYRDWLLKR
ncbi:hypothetical protein [Sorangium sp. So ce131]|uniref:hypothetical protein n=1 Tax=Sorangium sp. So ce131 TaxID=3133282 RepID=UPI003F5F9204